MNFKHDLCSKDDKNKIKCIKIQILPTDAMYIKLHLTAQLNIFSAGEISMSQYDVVIVGAGLIGLGIAFELKTREPLAKIVVVDKAEACQEASWASAGMLEPQLSLKGVKFHDAADLEKKFFKLCAEIQSIFSAFVQRVEQVSGIDCQYRTEGILKLIPTGQSPNDYLAWLESFLIRYIFLDAAELKVQEPHVREGFTAVHLIDNHQVENRKLSESLKTACLNLGVEVLENKLVMDFEVRKDNALAARMENDILPAGKFVITAGAWSSQFESLAGIVPEIKPKRGQILALQMSQKNSVRHPCYSEGTYFVPRNDGRILIGSTIEDAGFEKSTTADAIEKFQKKINNVIPESEKFAQIGAWAGLRPCTDDGFPYMGATRLKNLSIATGHFRNGVLLTPITARHMTDYILNDKTHIMMKPFSVKRHLS